MIQISFIINLHFSASVLTSGSRSVLLPVSSGSFSPDCFSCFHSKPNIPTRSGSRLAECFLLLLSESLFSAFRLYSHRFSRKRYLGNPPFHPALGGCLSFFHRQTAFTGGKHCAFICRKCIPAPCVYKKVSDSRRKITIRTSGTTRTASTVILAFLIFTFKAFRTSPQIQAAETAPAVWNPVSVFSSASEGLRRVPNRE